MNLPMKRAALALALAFAVAPALSAQEAADRHEGWMARMCDAKSGDGQRADWMQRRADRLAERLKLTDAQKAVFKDLQDARAKLRAERRAAFCASKPDLSSYEARLTFRETMLENRLADMKALQPKLVAFYNALNDYQKGEFDAMQSRGWGRGDRDRG